LFSCKRLKELETKVPEFFGGLVRRVHEFSADAASKLAELASPLLSERTFRLVEEIETSHAT
jgi:hypothetical protein